MEYDPSSFRLAEIFPDFIARWIVLLLRPVAVAACIRESSIGFLVVSLGTGMCPFCELFGDQVIEENSEQDGADNEGIVDQTVIQSPLGNEAADQNENTKGEQGYRGHNA